MSTRESGSSTQSTGTSWMRSPRRWASDEQLGVEEPAVVADVVEQPAQRVGARRLEAALRVAEAGAQRRVQESGCRRARSARAWGRARPGRRARGGSRSRGRCGPTAAARPAAAARAGRSRGRRPCSRRPARGSRPRRRAARARGPCARGAAPRRRGSSRGEPVGDLRRGVGAGVVGDDDPPAERELGGEEAVQTPDAVLQPGLLVVDGDDDVDLAAADARRRTGSVLA